MLCRAYYKLYGVHSPGAFDNVTLFRSLNVISLHTHAVYCSQLDLFRIQSTITLSVLGFLRD